MRLSSIKVSSITLFYGAIPTINSRERITLLSTRKDHGNSIFSSLFLSIFSVALMASFPKMGEGKCFPMLDQIYAVTADLCESFYSISR